MHWLINRLIIIIFCFPVLLLSEIVTDAIIGYSVDLPQNWVREIDSADQHAFYDSSGTFLSVIVISMTDFSSDNTYKTPSEWTRAHFLAYLITVRSTVSSLGVPLSDPYGTMVFYDSSTSVQSGYKSMELYAQFNSLIYDSLAWDEYIKYVAVDQKGYEIYVIGDTADMKKNMSYYFDFVDSIKINSSSQNAVSRPSVASRKYGSVKNASIPNAFDLLGRGYLVSSGAISSGKAAGILVRRKLKFFNGLH